jgi:formylmethanofuran dehydrogenase subunit B
LTSTGSSAAVTCLGCGCACDDIDLHVEAGRIVEARRACPLGVAWFGDGVVPARARVRGQDATLDDAVAAAATLLASSVRPLVYLAPDISCETQRAAIAVADRLHATLDSVTSSTAIASVLAAQEIGRAGATLGEIRNRADVLVFWGVDPAIRYPRYWSRYAPEPVALHVGGRASRTVVAVDVGNARGPADADVRITIAPGDEVSALTMARAAIGRESNDPLLAALRNGKYVAIVADAEPDDLNGDRDPGRAAALIGLAQALNGVTRCALSTLRGGGNRSGADACLTSQTGYPAAVEFTRGYPRYRPHDSGIARAARGQVDAALIVGAAAGMPVAARETLAMVPSLIIGPRATDNALARTEVAIDTGVAGIHETGTAVRMDDVPLPLRAPLSGPPLAGDVVATLAREIARRRGD